MPIWAFGLNSYDQSLSSASLNFANRGDDSQAKNLPKASGMKQPARRHFWVPQNSVAEVANQLERSIFIKPSTPARLKVLSGI